MHPDRSYFLKASTYVPVKAARASTVPVGWALPFTRNDLSVTRLYSLTSSRCRQTSPMDW
jgi:hypothetical protein